MSSQTRATETVDLQTDQAATADSETESDAQQASTSVEKLPLDQVFEILKNQRRRTVLHYLNEHEGPVSLGDLAEHVAAVENDTTVAQITSNERKCVYVGLYQCHLPKMDNMDIVAFNQNRGRIELGPNASQLDTYLSTEETTTRPWPLYYALAVLGGAVVLAVSVATGSGALGSILVAVLLSVSVGTVATVQYVLEHASD
jgi:hypothetical protein